MTTEEKQHSIQNSPRPPVRIGISGAKRAPAKPVEPSQKKKLVSTKKSEKSSAKKGAIFLSAIFAINLLFIIFSGQFEEFATSLDNADYYWVFSGFLAMCGYIACGSIAFMLAAYIDPQSPLGVRDCISVEASGVTFGNLTPMSAGVMPAQVLRLTKAGLVVGEATAMQLTRFVVFQGGEVIIAAVMLALKFEYFKDSLGNIIFLNVVVFFIQSCQVALLLLMCLFPKFVARVAKRAIRFAYKHTWISAEKRAEFIETVETQVSQFGTAFHAAIRHRSSVILTLFVTFFQILFFYSVPWFVLHAFGGDADFLVCLAGGAMVQMIGNSVPLPGGAGGIEAGFAIFFGPIFGVNAAAGFIVWRLITFYLPTVFCLPLTALKSRQTHSIYYRWNAFIGKTKKNKAYYSLANKEQEEKH